MIHYVLEYRIPKKGDYVWDSKLKTFFVCIIPKGVELVLIEVECRIIEDSLYNWMMNTLMGKKHGKKK